jgi:transcriptional regulator GlxA family with amidase domain
MRSRVRTIGLIAFPGVMALDLAGPLDAFHLARDEGGEPRYRCLILGAGRGKVETESGLRLMPHVALERAPPLDTVIVPGGAGLRVPRTQARVAEWLRDRAAGCRRVVSVCTGIYGLAASGLLDGRRATTHWQFAADVARRYPAVRLEANALFIRDGRFHTSAGVTAGIDLALALIEDDLGHRAAMSVARQLVVHLCRAGGQEQYSEPLRFQTESFERFAELVVWMRDHLAEDLSVDALAARAYLSPRHFTRRFKRAYGMTPGDFVERLRLDESRHRLVAGSRPVGEVAGAVGFASADVFRRAFERRVGIAPRAYRLRFGIRAGPDARHG